MIEKLKQEFVNVISKVYWENREGQKVLNIELNVSDFEQVQEISAQINTFVDAFDSESFVLDIFSSGNNLTITKDDLEKYIDQKIVLSLSKPYLNEYKIVVKLVEIKEMQLLAIKNNKGRMQKILIDKTNITNIEKFIDIKK
ncbi:hypothetical protein [Mycoplasma sp. 4044]